MRAEKIESEPSSEPWRTHRGDAADDRRSLHAMRIIELAHTLAVAETAVLMGNDAKALANLKQLQIYASEMVAALEEAHAGAS